MKYLGVCLSLEQARACGERDHFNGDIVAAFSSRPKQKFPAIKWVTDNTSQFNFRQGPLDRQLRGVYSARRSFSVMENSSRKSGVSPPRPRYRSNGTGRLGIASTTSNDMLEHLRCGNRGVKRRREASFPSSKVRMVRWN